MNLHIPSDANSTEKNKGWMKNHPILTSIVVLFFFGVVVNIFGNLAPEQASNEIGAIETQATQTNQVPETNVPEAGTSTDNTTIDQIADSQKSELKQSTPTEKIDLYSVTDVIDGDTIKISMNGTTETLRLIGIDTPETVDPRKPVQCFGKEASNMAKQLLSGKKVRIEADSTQDTRDKYGRLLVYVFREDGLFFNKHMIAEGYAYEYTYNDPYKYQTEFKSAEQSAETGGKGLWSASTCSGNPLIGTEIKTNTQTETTPVTQTSGTKYYTSSHYSAKYYYPEDCDGWKSLSPSNLKSFNTLEELLASYSRTKSPQCE